MQRYLTIDDVTGKAKLGAQASGSGPLYVVEDFDTGPSGQTNFTLAQAFLSQTLIIVMINGIEMREGVSKDFQRNVALNRIEFNYNIPKEQWVRFRIFP